MPINSFLYPGAKVTTGFNVANSCRFNDGDSAFLSKTLGTGTNTTKLTVSVWIKRSTLGTEQQIFETWNDNNNRFDILFKSSTDQLEIQNTLSGSTTINLKTNRVFRDPSAWMNIVVIVDSTQSTASNRVKLYINGTQETSFATETYLNEDANLALGTSSYTNFIGKYSSSGGNFFDGYMCEVVYLDGTAASIGDLGEFDEDSPTIWKPKDVSGLTFGNNGAYLDFEDSSNLGNDANGGTDYGETNLAATDQATDTPTNNFCTMNPLVPTTNITFSEGNCKMVVSSSGAQGGGIGTFGLTAGKWYWEVKIASTVGNHNHGAISENTSELYQNVAGLQNDTGVTCWRNDDGGEVVVDGTATTNDYGIMADGSIMGIALDMDNYNISYYDDGTALVTDFNMSTTRGTIFPMIHTGASTTSEVNFGGCSAFSISSAQSDANGYGNFEHAPPSGYLALCSKNLGSDGG
jgi:hypothetical protein